MTQHHEFYQLDPDTILDALDATGIEAEAALLALNSYENRVYQLRDFAQKRWVVKFYRPHRWSDEQILEEHQFSLQLAEAEIPVVAPTLFNDQSLLHFKNFRFSLFESRGGRSPNLDDEETLTWLGRFIGRIHLIGESQNYNQRPVINVDAYAQQSHDFVMQQGFVPDSLKESMNSVCLPLIEACVERFSRFSDIETFRIHGDCHPSNILWTDDGPHFVDLDDSRIGPAVQDLWMLITGAEQDKVAQRNALLDGYEEFREFDYRELHLVEALRAMRMMHYMAWLARRWEDPSFKHNFPWFNTQRYWEEQLLSLKEQLGTLQNEETPSIWQ
ncbi:serine/threonine protein kinase [Pleionea sp. CnH1-48]|uniref:serine/threonine protein kinase n=1 Tax=Pleionea sp. CnH1-48 TaxID=2954494 RepID=UPI002097C92C|nr:serine/threonine protein kinase [Pleionea sp. CnH1-48]MCO7225690.1 serine/threonine protein kinase [Pleionea sp. CnH1-48]